MVVAPVTVSLDLWRGFVNGAPHPVTYGQFTSSTSVRAAITYDPQDSDEFCLQLPRPDPRMATAEGDLCLGFQPICDTWVAAKSNIFSGFDDLIPNER